MKPSGDLKAFIDLSFLSPEEETVIQKVLLRDEDLKRLDTGRVRRLKDSVPDAKQLKVLSGEWFEELKSKRHGDQPHASVVVRSSMRWKKTAGHKPHPFPVTVLEDETAETHPGVPVDPRSIHPALSVEIFPEFRDEDAVLKDTPGHRLNDPALMVIKEQSQLRAENKDKSPPIVCSNHELALESNRVITLERETPELKSKQNSTKLKDKGNVEVKNFEIRSFSEALETSNWNTSRWLDGEALPTPESPSTKKNIPLDLQTGSVYNPDTRNQGTVDLRVMDPTEKKRSVKKITITNFRQNASEDPDALLDLQKCPVPEGDHLAPARTKKAGKENITDIRQDSQIRINKLNAKEDPDVLLDLHTEPDKAKTTTGASPTSVDLNPDMVKDQEVYALNRAKDIGFKQTILSVETERNKIAEPFADSEVPRRTMDFDVNFMDPVNADQKMFLPKQIEGRNYDDDRTESELLTGVYTQALRPKAQLKEEDVLIPTIVIACESTEPEEVESMNNGISAPEAPDEVRRPANGDKWEGESDSDEDSSASSHESDLSGKRSISASRLSVTERTGSLMSVYSDAGDFGNVAVQGSVEFAIMYSPLGELVIMVNQCQDLAVANLRKQRTDPYVKTYLYPDKRSKRKTSIKKRNIHPVFAETLRYKVKSEELPGRTLNLSVWHNDPRGRNVFLGQVEISLRNWDWKHETLTWYDLQPKNKDPQESEESNGVLSVALKYVPPESTGGSRLSKASGEIHIWLREARQLRRLKPQGVDSFVKCYMLPDTSKKSRQKTRVVKRSQDPVFNHTMVYDGFRAGEVGEACCELTVWDSNTLSNQFLGGVRLSLGSGLSYGKKVDWMDSENEETEIWKRMLENPNSWVEAELPLRSSMTPRK